MRKLIYTLIAFVVMSIAACSDYLDTDKYFNDTLVFDSVWTNKNYTEGWLSNVYANLWSQSNQKDIRKISGGPLFSADDLFYGDWLGHADADINYQDGRFGPDDTYGNDTWNVDYQAIRKATLFIQNVDKCKQMKQSEIDDAKAQARFVRAYLYYKLIERYGPVAILPEEGLDPSAPYENLGTPRCTMDSCISYVSNQLAQAAKFLPLTRVKSELERPTRGAALAIRAEMLILAASPLFNSANTPIYNLKDDKGNNLITNDYNEEKWAKAAAAAKEVIDLGQYYLFTVKKSATTVAPPTKAGYSDANYPKGWADIDPYQSYAQLFNGTVHLGQINEIIWANANNDEINHIEEHCIPRYVKGWNTVAVTQKQVDAYQMCDGRDIANSSAAYPYKAEGFYDVTNPEQVKCGYVQNDVSLRYVNREPRFYVSIGYNGTVWPCLSITQDGTRYHNYRSNYYKGGSDGKNLSEIGFHPYSGYTMHKYYNEEDGGTQLAGAKMTDKVEPIVRYAEVLLWYAEAMNHLTKSYTETDYTGQNPITVSRDVNAMHNCIRPIRVRSGLPDYEDNVYANESTFTKAIKHERQIEFFGEAKRYWDLNRWLDAMVEENMKIMGCNMEMSDSGDQKQRFYSPVVITLMPKSFLERQYLWPLPTGELKRNAKVTQNPGW